MYLLYTPPFSPPFTPPQEPLPSDSLPHKAPENGIHHELYPLVNQHSNGISPCLTGNASSNGPFSIAMLDHRSVIHVSFFDVPYL